MSETLCVLALDAADNELAKRWNCQNLLLERSRPVETFAHSKDEPYSPEVWATVATGVGPKTHGIGEDRQEVHWDNPLLRAASHLTQHLPPRYRQALGRPFRRRGATQTFQEITDGLEDAFDATLSWPGLGEATHLRKMWRTADQAVHDDLDASVVHKRFHALTGQELGWLVAMNNTDRAVVGAHAHVLDIAGHLYAERPDELREWYEWVDEQVGWLRSHCDRLVVLSDHGIQTSALDDSDPGSHSWRAFIATQGVEGPLPESVFGVAAALDEWAPKRTGSTDGHVNVDTPTETLENLGYLDT